MENVAQVYAGDAYAMVVKTDGTLWAMGQNDRGQFGTGNRTSSNIPIRLPIDNVASIAASGNHTLAIRNDGSLWAWGQNDRGQLGVGNTRNSARPIRVTSGVAAVTAGDRHTVAVMNDGSVWVWGFNHRGQLGNGTNINRHIPLRMTNLSVASRPQGTQNVTLPETSVEVPPVATLPGNNIRLFINGEQMFLESPPHAHEGTVMVPMRAIFTALGAEIRWNRQTSTVTATKENVTISHTVMSNVLIRNGEEVRLDVASSVVGRTTFVPVSAVSESFGAQVLWDPSAGTVTITTE